MSRPPGDHMKDTLNTPIGVGTFAISSAVVRTGLLHIASLCSSSLLTEHGEIDRDVYRGYIQQSVVDSR